MSTMCKGFRHRIYPDIKGAFKEIAEHPFSRVGFYISAENILTRGHLRQLC